MPMRRTKIHPKIFTDNLASFFPSRVRIEEPILADSGTGSGAKTVTGWKVIYDNVPAAISAVIRLGEEFRNWRLEFPLEQVTHRIILQGYYPNIRADHRMVTDGGEIHDITARHLDSHSNLTRLNTRLVSPEAIEGVG